MIPKIKGLKNKLKKAQPEIIIGILIIVFIVTNPFLKYFKGFTGQECSIVRKSHCFILFGSNKFVTADK